MFRIYGGTSISRILRPGIRDATFLLLEQHQNQYSTSLTCIQALPPPPAISLESPDADKPAACNSSSIISPHRTCFCWYFACKRATSHGADLGGRVFFTPDMASKE